MTAPIPLRAGFDTPITRAEIHAALAAVRSVVAHDGPWPAGARRLAEAVAWKSGDAIDLDTIAPATARGTSDAIVDPVRRTQLVRLVIVAAMLDGRPSRELAGRVRALADTLGVATPEVVDLELLAAGRLLRMRRHLAPRFWPVGIARAHARNHGMWSIAKMIFVWLGLAVDRAIRSRFVALDTLPPDSLGPQLLAFWRRAGFGLPGERRSPPFIVFYHDISHVLAGYGTDPASEVQAGCFQGGYQSADGFTLVFFVLCQFHLGIRVTPIAKAEVGMFDPYRALDAICRGAGMNRDLVDGTWDPWAAMAEPIEVLRTRYHLVPPAAPHAAA